ncbi:hypothetical protein J6590_060688 [Homalodisca vitripennis]|nr:hypothetical protein J6590_060688 [Homalodisca vitripennis]
MSPKTAIDCRKEPCWERRNFFVSSLLLPPSSPSLDPALSDGDVNARGRIWLTVLGVPGGSNGISSPPRPGAFLGTRPAGPDSKVEYGGTIPENLQTESLIQRHDEMKRRLSTSENCRSVCLTQAGHGTVEWTGTVDL